MSEEIERTKGLLSTDDPEVWSQEFCRIFAGKLIRADDVEGALNEIGPSTLVDWFANCIETVKRLGEQRDEIASNVAPIGMVPEAQRESFIEGFSDGRSEARPTDLDDPSKP